MLSLYILPFLGSSPKVQNIFRPVGTGHAANWLSGWNTCAWNLFLGSTTGNTFGGVVPHIVLWDETDTREGVVWAKFDPGDFCHLVDSIDRLRTNFSLPIEENLAHKWYLLPDQLISSFGFPYTTPLPWHHPQHEKASTS